MTEGVVKYRLDYQAAPPPDGKALGDLPAWHTICHRLGLVGQTPGRYGGLAYGNLSRRLGPECFVISGTQTGGRERPDPADYTRVTGWDVDRNWVRAEGPCQPSSESLTHAALYQGHRAIGSIIHVHSPELWRSADVLGLPSTDPAVPYGTPALAREVWRLCESRALGARGAFAMGGHTDGIVAFGGDAEAAGLALMALLAQALLRS
jgi:hypothetical protein